MLIATAECRDEIEMTLFLGKLASIHNISVEVQGLRVGIAYEPQDCETSREEELTIAKITDTLNSTATHGVCII